MASDGLQARFGSLTASLERFMPWRTVDGSVIAPKGAPGCCQSNANQSLKLQATSLSGRQLAPFCQGS